jgi:hypothetical protein
VVFGLSQEEHPEKPGLFVEHRHAPLLLETSVRFARWVDLRVPHAHDHRPFSAFAITGCLALFRSRHSFCLFTTPRGHSTTFLTIDVLPSYGRPAGHVDRWGDPRNPPSFYREASWSGIDRRMDRGVEIVRPDGSGCSSLRNLAREGPSLWRGL